MKREEELEYVRAALKTYDELERKAVSRLAWIMLKLSCSRAKAARLIAKALEDKA